MITCGPSVDGIYRDCNHTPTYREVLHLEMERQLAQDVAFLGPKPPWWRFRMRRLYPQKVQVFREYQMSSMRWLLAEQDPRRRSIMANLIGWQLPRQYADDFATVIDSPDPDIGAMLNRFINIKRGDAPDTPIDPVMARYLLRFWVDATRRKLRKTLP